MINSHCGKFIIDYEGGHTGGSFVWHQDYGLVATGYHYIPQHSIHFTGIGIKMVASSLTWVQCSLQLISTV